MFMATSNAKNWYAQALLCCTNTTSPIWAATANRSVIFAHNLHTGELHTYWSWDHMHNAPAGLPLLVLDMYEHAYHMDYGAAAAKYVDAFMQNVNWEEVNRRAEAAVKAGS